VSSTALVYRGAASCDGCPEALAALLQGSRWEFAVRYVGEKEKLKVSPATLAGASLYGQPGGGNSVKRAYRRMAASTDTIRQYVRSGGHYLGICMGGYLAGHWRGFGLLPEDTDQFITSAGASVTTAKDTLVDVDWGNQRCRMFFQDGPVFRLPPAPKDVTVLARYASNGEIAAMVASYGRGRVGVCGPHPEATEDWYESHRLLVDRPSITFLGHDLIDHLMAP
jgi:glutamine amidotransferase-like uncharacterized protein